MGVLTLVQKANCRLIQEASHCNTVRLSERMVDLNVSNDLPGAEELGLMTTGCLVRATEGFGLLVTPVDEVLK